MTSRTVSTPARPSLPMVLATAGSNTSNATRLWSGRASDIGTSESPMPEPISTITGRSRPNAEAQSTAASGCTDVCRSPRGTSMT